uniref:Sodium-and chloride-dependent neutral and basic amino acid transporter B(0+) n=1 Tax=Parastrongyloides trichosuri TaxID=131310 RepID=A0A0N4ZDM1_PARTI
MYSNIVDGGPGEEILDEEGNARERVGLMDDKESKSSSSEERRSHLKDYSKVELVDSKLKMKSAMKTFPKSRFLKYIYKVEESNTAPIETEIPSLESDEEVKLYWRNVNTLKTRMIEGSRHINTGKMEYQDFSDSLDVMDHKSEPSLVSYYGKLISLLAGTYSPTNIFTIVILTILHGKEFLGACFYSGIFLCIPMMYLEILLGQITPVNSSSLFSKMCQAWSMMRVMFVTIYFLSGVYSVIFALYFLVGMLSTLLEGMDSTFLMNICSSLEGKNCIRKDFTYFCMYGDRYSNEFTACNGFHSIFEEGYRMQSEYPNFNARYLDKLSFTFNIIPFNSNPGISYTSCFCVWLLIAIFKMIGYGNMTGVMIFFYSTFVISLVLFVHVLLKNELSYIFLKFFFRDIYLEKSNIMLWLAALVQMIKFYKSGHGIVMKIASYFEPGSNNVHLAFVVFVINTIVFHFNIILLVLSYGITVEGDIKDTALSVELMSKGTIRAYTTSALEQIADMYPGYCKTLFILYNFGFFGLSVYQAFLYIDLMDCELHNIYIRHVRYATKRYKTTAAITFLFLLLPMFSMMYRQIGELYFLIEETFTFNVLLNCFQYIIIVYGIGYGHLHIPTASSRLSHILKKVMGWYIKYIAIPMLIGVIVSIVVIGVELNTEYVYFIREKFAQPYVNTVQNIYAFLCFFCVLIWPIYQMLRAVFYGKRSTSVFKCELVYVNDE